MKKIMMVEDYSCALQFALCPSGFGSLQMYNVAMNYAHFISFSYSSYLEVFGNTLCSRTQNKEHINV